MDRGYTLLWRKTWNNDVLHERGKRFSRLEAWLYITNVLARGTDDPESGMKRGEFEASVRYLCKAWRWGIASVVRLLRDLEQNQMIKKVERSAERLPERYAERFSVCNYETYNPPRNAERNATRNAERNKVKEGFKEGKTTSQTAGAAVVDSLPSVEAYRLSEMLRTAILKRDPHSKASKLPDTASWARDVDKLMRIDGRRAEDIEAVIAWCQIDGCFWGPNILSGRKLREKFDTMWGQMHRGNGNGASHGNPPEQKPIPYEVEWEYDERGNKIKCRRKA